MLVKSNWGVSLGAQRTLVGDVAGEGARGWIMTSLEDCPMLSGHHRDGNYLCRALITLCTASVDTVQSVLNASAFISLSCPPSDTGKLVSVSVL